VAYSDFDLASVRESFDLKTVEDINLFGDTPEIQPGDWLRQTLAVWAPWAAEVNTEKSRSEMIIAPILLEVTRLLEHRVRLFSGITFDVDREKGLTGTCDFLLSRSPERFFVERPVLAVVEAKREDIIGGLGQCVAAMVAAQVFNARRDGKKNIISAIYGAVTTGTIWRFLKLEGRNAMIDPPEYYLAQVGKILGILVGMAA
jgi:hypothetical protein